MIKLSFVLSVYNEIESLPELVERVGNVAKSLQVDYELVFVDDGSEDGSTQWLLELSHRDEHVILVAFSRNIGHGGTCPGFNGNIASLAAVIPLHQRTF